MSTDLALAAPSPPPLALFEPVAEDESVVPDVASSTVASPAVPPGLVLPSIDVLASDPTAFLAQLSAALRDASNRQALQQAEFGNAQAEQAEVDRQESLERAERASRRGRRLLRRCPRWLKRLIRAVITAVSTVAAAFSGGAGAVLLVGLILAMVADPLAKALQKVGLIDERAAMWLSTGLKLVGAALSLGAGAGRAVEASAQLVGEAVRRAIDVAAGVMTAVDVEYGARSAATGYIATQASLDAEGAATRITESQEWIEAAAEALREASNRFERVLTGLGEGAESRHEARFATARSFA